MKIVTIVGARPQFIKATMLSKEIKKNNNIEEVMIHTGQHFHRVMSEIFFEELDIPQPKYNLQISSLSHGAMTGRMLEEIEKILIKENPDLIIVYGDTNSTLAGSLAASKLNIPIAHIESGLRSFNKKMPEEINRIITDHLSTYLFCPTPHAMESLRKENIHNNIFNVGDIMYDSFLFFQDFKNYSVLENLNIQPNSYCLLTLHRQENTNNHLNLFNLFVTLLSLSKEFNLKMFFPMHPRIHNFLQQNNFPFLEFQDNFIFNSPVSYLDMLELEKNAELILTDSGGMQKEAYWSNVPCITLRDETEWTELTDLNVNKLTGLNTKKIIKTFEYFVNNRKSIFFKNNIYGDGKTSKKILDVLKGI